MISSYEAFQSGEKWRHRWLVLAASFKPDFYLRLFDGRAHCHNFRGSPASPRTLIVVLSASASLEIVRKIKRQYNLEPSFNSLAGGMHHRKHLNDSAVFFDLKDTSSFLPEFPYFDGFVSRCMLSLYSFSFYSTPS